jgi:hypothetical protein
VALIEKLNAAEAAQAVESMLNVLASTTDRYAMWALISALASVAAKMTPVQAIAAITGVLKEPFMVGKPTDKLLGALRQPQILHEPKWTLERTNWNLKIPRDLVRCRSPFVTRLFPKKGPCDELLFRRECHRSYAVPSQYRKIFSIRRR